MTKAIFFDLDGVLIDSETVQYHLFCEHIQQQHLAVPKEAFVELIGSHKSLDPWDEMIRKYQIPLSKEKLQQAMFGSGRERFMQMNKREIMFPEVPEVLKRLRSKGILLACASSSSRPYIEKALHQCGILELFDVLASSDDFAASKPAPDIYLYCMAALKVLPSECLVIEDSPIGIEAAKAAGIQVLARINPNINLNQSQADGWILSLNEIE